MRLLLVPDLASPNGEDAFCREISRRAHARKHLCVTRMAPSGPPAAQAELLAGEGFARDCDAVIINGLQPPALLAAQAAVLGSAVFYSIGFERKPMRPGR